MNLQVISEHTFDLDLLPEKGANILDLGARGFGIRKAFPQHNVICVDVDSIVFARSPLGVNLCCAVLDYDGFCDIRHSNDPQATQAIKTKDYGGIPCYKLETLIEIFDVEFDAIKFDIEGSEYEVIMSLTNPPTKQISVEFHLHCGQTEGQVHEMVGKLVSLGYTIVQNEKTARHGLPPNYWDSLFVL